MTKDNSDSEPDTFTREVSLDHIDQPEGVAVFYPVGGLEDNEPLQDAGGLAYCSEELVEPNKSIGSVYEAEIEVGTCNIQSLEYKPDKTVESKVEGVKTLNETQDSDLWRTGEEDPQVSVGYSDRYEEQDEE